MDDQIKEFLRDIPMAWRSRKIIEHQEYVEYLSRKYPSYDLKHQIQFILGDLEVEPVCKNCGGKLKLPHNETCSAKCREAIVNRESRYAKYQQTCLENWGVDNVLKSPEIRQKITRNNYEKYGTAVSHKTIESARSRINELNEKGRKTLNEKYGVDNPGQLKDHREKCKHTLIENHGVDIVSNIPELKEKRETEKLKKLIRYSNDISIIGIEEATEYKKNLYDNPNQVILFRCNICLNENELPWETFKWRIKNLETPCADCSDLKNGSKGENEVFEFVKSLGVYALKNDRNIIHPKELDIYCPENKVAIEYDGLFWHNDLRIDKNYHLEKTNSCREKGIHLIHIFEDEWLQKRQIVENRLRHALMKNYDRIYARNTTIKEIKTDTAKEFINEYHIQGYTRSSIKLGIYFEYELVGVMTFSKPTRAKGVKNSKKNEWEISRSCFSRVVVGGTSKLIKYFTCNYEADYLFTYADLRWGDGESYKNAGMIRVKDTTIGYWYIEGDRRIHRYALRKNSMDDQKLTEYENRLNQGYLRIWDCGHAKYVWNKKGAEAP